MGPEWGGKRGRRARATNLRALSKRNRHSGNEALVRFVFGTNIMHKLYGICSLWSRNTCRTCAGTQRCKIMSRQLTSRSQLLALGGQRHGAPAAQCSAAQGLAAQSQKLSRTPRPAGCMLWGRHQSMPAGEWDKGLGRVTMAHLGTWSAANAAKTSMRLPTPSRPLASRLHLHAPS